MLSAVSKDQKTASTTDTSSLSSTSPSSTANTSPKSNLTSATSMPHESTDATAEPSAMATDPATTTDTADPVDSDKLRSRVKLYELIGGSQWEDQGTGFSTIVYVEVRSEVDGGLLLENPILKTDVYQRQQDTLIVWTEPDGQDLALSFQDVRGCEQTWESILEIQKRLAHLDSVRFGHEDIMQDLETEMSMNEPVAMPDIELKNLEQVEAKTLEYLRTAYGREKFVAFVVKEKFIDQICNLFEMAEDLEMLPEIQSIHNILKALVMLNEQSIFEILLREDLIKHVCGVFEYDPDYNIPKRQYRDFISNPARFKRVRSFENDELEAKIHQTYRAQYLKDVVLARIIEESHFSVMTSIVIFNQVEILNTISKNQEFLAELVREFRDPDATRERKVTILSFIQDFCNIAKSVQMINRQGFYRALASNGLFQEIPPFLSDEDYCVRMAAAEVIANVLEHDASLMRSFVLSQNKHNSQTLTSLVIERLVEDEDSGMKFQYAEILRMFLEQMPPSAESNIHDDPENAKFLHYFYAEAFPLLVKPLRQLEFTTVTDHGVAKDVLVLDQTHAALCNHIVELLCFMIRTHPSRIKYVLLGDDLLMHVNKLLSCRDNSIKLVAIRLYKTVVAAKDEFYNRWIIKNDLFSPIIRAFDENGTKYNLLNSACLNLMEFIRTENIKSLVKYMVDKFRKSLEAITYIDVGKTLILRHDQNNDFDLRDEPGQRVTTGSKTVPNKGVWGAIDANEEAYFNDDDPEDDSPMAEEDESPLPPTRRRDDDDEDDILERRFAANSKPASSPTLSRGRSASGQASPGRKINFVPAINLKSDTSAFGESSPASASPSGRSRYGLVDYDDDLEEDRGNDTSAQSTAKDDDETSSVASSNKRSISALSPHDSPPTPQSANATPMPGENTTPTKIRSIMIGTKRMAIDSGWDKETVMDIGPGQPGTSSPLSVKPRTPSPSSMHRPTAARSPSPTLNPTIQPSPTRRLSLDSASAPGESETKAAPLDANTKQ